MSHRWGHSTAGSCSSNLQTERPETHTTMSHQAAHSFAQATGHRICSNNQQ